VRKDGIFIAIEVDDTVTADAALAAKLAEVCPVDIFAATNGRLEIVERNIDECVLCRLCLDAVGGRDPIPVRVLKLYEDGAEL
jgi:NAD-dependent dihydropyrimidine dehydrogenase PreA subunit